EADLPVRRGRAAMIRLVVVAALVTGCSEIEGAVTDTGDCGDQDGLHIVADMSASSCLYLTDYGVSIDYPNQTLYRDSAIAQRELVDPHRMTYPFAWPQGLADGASITIHYDATGDAYTRGAADETVIAHTHDCQTVTMPVACTSGFTDAGPADSSR